MAFNAIVPMEKAVQSAGSSAVASGSQASIGMSNSTDGGSSDSLQGGFGGQAANKAKVEQQLKAALAKLGTMKTSLGTLQRMPGLTTVDMKSGCDSDAQREAAKDCQSCAASGTCNVSRPETKQYQGQSQCVKGQLAAHKKACVTSCQVASQPLQQSLAACQASTGKLGSAIGSTMDSLGQFLQGAASMLGNAAGKKNNGNQNKPQQGAQAAGGATTPTSGATPALASFDSDYSTPAVEEAIAESVPDISPGADLGHGEKEDTQRALASGGKKNGGVVNPTSNESGLGADEGGAGSNPTVQEIAKGFSADFAARGLADFGAPGGGDNPAIGSEGMNIAYDCPAESLNCTYQDEDGQPQEIKLVSGRLRLALGRKWPTAKGGDEESLPSYQSFMAKAELLRSTKSSTVTEDTKPAEPEVKRALAGSKN